MNLLGIETSCDETAAAVVQDGVHILSSVVSTQFELHEAFGGVVPEIACRAHVQSVLPAVDRALTEAGIAAAELDGIAVTTTPGLIGALLIGASAAKALAWALEKPLLAANHLHQHIYGAWLAGESPALPAISLVVSGGHTSLFLTRGPLDHTHLGGTVDDAAGEAFDKVANILKLGYPGGPAIERVAASGNTKAFDFPRSWLKPNSADFSFSGLKTAVLYHCLGTNVTKEDIARASYEPQFVADTAASFQEAVVDVLVGKAFCTVEAHGARSLVVGGGVAANSRLRERAQEEASEAGVQLHLAPRQFCTDNAAMTAGLGYYLLRAGKIASLDASVTP